MSRSEVLIAGAGPTGIVLALWLTRQGVKVRIIDKTDGPGTTSRAVAVQARTSSSYTVSWTTDEVLEQGHRVPAINLWVQGGKQTRISFENFAADLTPYGPITYAQDQHERLLIQRAEAMGVGVERRTELLRFSDTGGESPSHYGGQMERKKSVMRLSRRMRWSPFSRAANNRHRLSRRHLSASVLRRRCERHGARVRWRAACRSGRSGLPRDFPLKGEGHAG